MKFSKIALTVVALSGIITFGSCKKNYTCTCTTIVGPVSNVATHSIDNTTASSAKRTCNDYEDEANKSMPGSTTCHL